MIRKFNLKPSEPDVITEEDDKSTSSPSSTITPSSTSTPSPSSTSLSDFLPSAKIQTVSSEASSLADFLPSAKQKYNGNTPHSASLKPNPKFRQFLDNAKPKKEESTTIFVSATPNVMESTPMTIITQPLETQNVDTTNTIYISITGPKGEDGKDGKAGKDGQSIIGPRGQPGPRGLTGETGATGYTGYTGYTGPTGPQGIPGFAAHTGATGPCGRDGIDGLDGRDGINGIDGNDGLDGIDGVDGLDGIDGRDGLGCVYYSSMLSNPAMFYLNNEQVFPWLEILDEYYSVHIQISANFKGQNIQSPFEMTLKLLRNGEEISDMYNITTQQSTGYGFVNFHFVLDNPKSARYEVLFSTNCTEEDQAIIFNSFFMTAQCFESTFNNHERYEGIDPEVVKRVLSAPRATNRPFY